MIETLEIPDVIDMVGIFGNPQLEKIKPRCEPVRINGFVDLDETLIHAEDTTNNTEPIELEPGLKYRNITFEHPHGVYTAVLRPGAIDLLFRLRQISDVYLITRATKDYAKAMNSAFALGFEDSKIIPRDMVKRCYYVKLDIPFGKNYLIDDFDQADNFEKIRLLRQLGPLYYIKVMPFWGLKEQDFSETDIEDMINNIVNS